MNLTSKNIEFGSGRLLFDLEANGLTPTHLWCFSILDLDAKEIRDYGPSRLDEALEVLKKSHTLIGHNIIGYDLPQIKRLYGIDLTDKVLIDTLVLSRLFNPTQEGGHSLEAWGYRLGYKKVEHEDWDNFSPEMQVRCNGDVRLNYKVFKALEKTGKQFAEESKNLERDVALIINQQIANGWLFDYEKAEELLAKVNDELGITEDKVRETFLPKEMRVKEVTPKLKKDGTLSKQGLRPDEYTKVLLSGNMNTFTRYNTQVFNLASRQQIGIWLQDFGWKPKKFTDNGQPKVDETVLQSIEGIPEADLINYYLGISKIRGFLENWLDSVGEDGRQHGYVNPNGAVTGRMSHSKPNLAQVPSSRKKYGAECRSLFIVPKGYTLVGMDADGLELRMLAHYMDNEAYTEAVANGNKENGSDAHSVNMRAAGLDDRDQAKTMFYALIYGAGDGKMGSIIGGKVKEGRELKAKLFGELPALGDLIDRVKSAASRGVLKGLDGRMIHVRSPHSSLNTLLQGAGAVVMKRALVILCDLADSEGLEYKMVGNIHDEIQCEVLDAHVERYSELALKAMVMAGEYYDLRCPLKGDVSIGRSWNETH